MKEEINDVLTTTTDKTEKWPSSLGREPCPIVWGDAMEIAEFIQVGDTLIIAGIISHSAGLWSEDAGRVG